MKRTNVVIDEKKLEMARRLTGLSTVRELVDAGLAGLIAREQRRSVLGLRGGIDWQGDLK